MTSRRSQTFPSETAASEWLLDMELAGWQHVSGPTMLFTAFQKPYPWIVHVEKPGPVAIALPRLETIGASALSEVRRQLGFGDGPVADAA